MATRTAHLVAQLTDKVSKPAAQMAQGLKKAADQADALTRLSAKGGTGKLAADLRNLGASASHIDSVTAAMKRYAAQNMIPANRADWTKVQASQMRTWEQSTVASLKHVIAAEREAARAAQDFASAQLAAAVKAGEASRKQRQAALEQAKAHREAIRERRRDAASTIASGAAVMAAHKGKKIGLDAVSSAASFDIAVRKQREFTDITAQIQAGLLAQAKRVGQETQFSNEDVVKAQTASMQGLPANFTPELRAAVAEGIVDNVRNFATLMETDLKEGAEIIRGYLQQSGKDISTKQKALAEANRATNQLVKMAKLGGMSGEDVGQFVKLAMSSGTTAGLTTDSLMSLAALAKRGGLRGDEAGTFVKTSAGKLVSPTKKGLAAFNAAGVEHSRFVKMPDRLSTSALEGQFRMEMGKGFTPGIRKRLDAINGDKTLLADQSRYIAAVTSAVEPILGKKKNGQVRASDRQVAAKAAGNYHKVAAQSVDVEGLLDALMKANPTLAQLNAIFTGAHGGKGAITQRQWDEFKASREEIRKSGDDPDYAAKKAREVMAGLGGSIENLKGSFENLVLTIGTANEGLIKLSADSLGNLIDKFSKLDQGTQQALSLGAGGAALAGGAYGAFNLTKALLGFGTSSAALTGSAVALDASAAALTAAAAKLAGGSVVGDLAGGAAKGKAGAAGRLAKMGPLGFLGWAGVGAGAMIGTGLLLDSFDEHRHRGNGYRGDSRRRAPTLGLDTLPQGWGAGGLDVSKGLGGGVGPYTTNREKTWGEWFFGRPTHRGGSDPTRMTLPLPPGMQGGGSAVAPKTDTTAFQALEQKMGDVQAKAGELNGLTISIPATSTGLGTIIQQMQQIISLGPQVSAAMNGGTGARTGKVQTAMSGAFSDKGMG